MSCWDCVFNAWLKEIAEEADLSIMRVPVKPPKHSDGCIEK